MKKLFKIIGIFVLICLVNISDNNIFANNEMTEDEREAVSTYSGQYYVEIKKFLRTGEIEEEWREWAEKITNLVSNVIQKFGIDVDRTLYKGVPGVEYFRWTTLGLVTEEDVVEKKIVGKEFCDPAFFSTSEDYNIAKSFSEQEIIFIIRSSLYSKALNMHGISAVETKREFLFDKGRIFRIIDVKIMDYKSGCACKYEIVLDVIN